GWERLPWSVHLPSWPLNWVSWLSSPTGPDSPMAPLKDLTQAVRKQQQELEARLEACLAELRKLCLREAELTGMLPPEYPLKQGDKLPKVRRRIGTTFKLDEKTIISRGGDPLSTLERDLALQLQITAAAQRLYREENISKHLKKRRKNMVLKEEKKLKELEMPCPPSSPPLFPIASLELSALEDSSLSDASLQHEPQSEQQREGLPPTCCEIPQLERSPIQNSPWKETSLDKPYEKPRKPSADSQAIAPAPAPPHSPSTWKTAEVPPCRFIPIRNLAMWRQAGSGRPPTPDVQARRGQSQSMRVDMSQDRLEPRGRSMLPRRRPTYYTVTVPNYCFPPSKAILVSNPIYHSSSEDSNSDISSISYAPSPGSSSPDISFLRPVPPPRTEQPSPVFRGQRSEGHETAYYYQKLLLPPSPSYFPAVEYVPESHPVAGREFCRGRPSLMVDSPPPFPYEQDAAQLRYQWLVPAHSRIVRTPSLKDYTPASSRALSKTAVSEELKSWQERTKLRSLRPHSLDRQGAFRVRVTSGRELYASRCAGQRAQVPQTHVLRRSPEGAPVQVYVPENDEIVTQV
uniref:Innate immunity activator n=1 Tax=Pelusios castaneus TaxID=367368 RepID=A0A8C8SEF0_9SAUR